MWARLGQSPLFRRLATIYDQVALKGIRVCLTPQTAVTNTGTSTTMIYNWDRNGKYEKIALTDSNNAVTGLYYYSPKPVQFPDIAAYGSAKTVSLGNLSVARNYYMAIYPKTTQEKICYLATNDVALFTDTNVGTLPDQTQWTPTLNVGLRNPTTV